MERSVFTTEDETIPLEGLQIGLLLDTTRGKVIFDTQYLGITDAFLAQGVARAILADDQDAIIFHHPLAPFIGEFDGWFDRLAGGND